ncbi:MAG: hypothetical protein ACRDHN_01140 [Thermomicrobiales bacterium]
MSGEIDKRGRLDAEVFTYRAVKNGTVFIAWNGRTVTTLSGKEAERFLAKVSGLTDRDVQLVMAKATGNFKHGNER